ncbi:MAG: leucyl aminopeptidase family protein [Alphaproteobacteria bacterium]|nr:leucyl aminopeptidase family protein [Alphaproteobacteria bacterium]MDP6515927.1 leucyl aminopeptidase family protein [Alphaproteobacteria bacterium]
MTAETLAAWLPGQSERIRAWVGGTGFAAKPGAHCLVPGANGAPSLVLAGTAETRDPWSLAELPTALPEGQYRLDPETEPRLAPEAIADIALGWALGSYRYGRYKAAERAPAVLWVPDSYDLAPARRLARAVTLVRDLINTPASDMGPADLADAAAAVAESTGASLAVIAGDALLDANYPTIHAVGRASTRAPCLIDLAWGSADAPKVTLVGKGVCFDSGGLDIKPADGMRLMKKDMGGAAHVLGLAQAVIEADLGLRLRVLVPAVDNSISGAAFRPGDVVRTRSGLSVEIGNTDAEGRLVLCDALAEADSESPELLIDIATLTGAARVALGTDIAALFTDDDDLAADILRHGRAVADPIWRLPLWHEYRSMLDSDIADLNNISESRYAGAISAALYLNAFVEKAKSWAHFDIMGWNPKPRPGRPRGGEALAVRALFSLLAERYGG